MPSPPILDFTGLTAPIPGDNPAGTPVPYDTREKLEELRRETNPQEIDPGSPEQPKKADWAGIVRLSLQTLTGVSKDLLVAARLTEALVKLYDFAGLRDGLRLLHLLSDQCWDRLYPSIEDGDLEIRAGPFNWLDVPDRGARFPTSVRLVPIIFGEGVRLSLADRSQVLKGKGPISAEELEKAIGTTPLGTCKQALEDLDQSLATLTTLTQVLNEKMGALGPSFAGLRPAVEECRFVLHQIVQRRTPAAPEEAATGDGQRGETPGSPAGEARAVTTRAEAYRQLARAAAVLKELEPHSPIPYLVQRAVELGSLPFPELIRSLIRDANVLTELNRELGIKPPE
jgi:type VI secretion system protein ImpA